MIAHLVAFESPLPKVYEMLPPPVEDLDDVLAILFTGPCKPTEEEFKRSPVLVRRHAIRAALEWLILNHSDYADVKISAKNLAEYPETSPIVSVVYRERGSDKISEATSIHDTGEGDGVESGECPFVVHGLTGEQMGTNTVEALKGMAMEHWNSGGMALRVGQHNKMESIYNNPDLYPQMFPWLFPYGLGGVGSTSLSDDLHKKHLLMYHDKRFQTDLAFPFAAFSHRQIKAAATGGYLAVDSKNFDDITDRLLSVNQDVLGDIAKRMAQGEVVKPVTEDEKACFQVIRDLDHVGGKVDGSVSSKKYMRNEIWSLVANQGAPSWYITLSPSDMSHPICLYFADEKETFQPLIRGYDERFRLIAKNPVAAARFFDFMVKLFIKHVLGFGTDHAGIYGETSAYYGTVEQQGRLTLHLHLLLWIRNGLTPEEARKAIMDPDSPFQQQLVRYLEAAHQGEFCTGSMDDVDAALTVAAEDPTYQNPTLTLPEAPPEKCTDSCKSCERCESLDSWWSRFRFTVDDILFRSNVHSCRSTINRDGSQSKSKQYAGCLDNKWGRCRGRFPRPIYTETEVDPATGSLHIKKLEAWMNTVSATVTYLFRCNTDVTSLRSGTAIKGVMYYVTKYVTKTSLKTCIIFETVQSIFQKNTEVLGGSATRQEKARTLMTKIVNSLTTKLEMGSPMICLYLLGNPDHYKSHRFRNFHWQSFVTEVLSAWPDQEFKHACLPERVILLQRNGRVVGLSPVYDYMFRAPELECMCLYDWVSRCTRVKGHTEKYAASSDGLHDTEAYQMEHESSYLGGGGPSNRNYRAGGTIHRFQAGRHPLATTHSTLCLDAKYANVPNFTGKPLPCSDRGDREYYCATMLTFFKPWRSGLDLKASQSTWEDAFNAEQFTLRHQTFMKNFNIQYECMDAQDDFHAQMKKGNAQLPSWTLDAEKSYLADFEQDEHIHDYTFDEAAANKDPDDSFLTKIGNARRSRDAAMQEMSAIVRNLGWPTPEPTLLPTDTDLKPKPPSVYQPGSQWKATVMNERAGILEKRLDDLPVSKKSQELYPDPNIVNVVDKSYLEKACKSKEWSAAIKTVIADFTLNKEQQRAFTIVANHAVNPSSEPLKMYIGGMGGTGKTQVLTALSAFFDIRKEPHRFVVVAPTGTAASLLGGSTYHYMFGISDMHEQTNTQLAQVRSRLTGVDYVFFDEVSMLSCRDLYAISARLAKVLSKPEVPFGGMNMIFAGDFAQLPPAMGGESVSLYSRTVGTSGVSLRDQESAIGKALWHQITTVVILRKNERQQKVSPEDISFRRALENMRYKSCTPEDLAFLRSRMSSALPGRSSIAEERFRNVSVITSFNVDKDAINVLGTQRFAEETDQQLVDFYSEDLVAPPEDPKIQKQRKVAGKRARITKQLVEEKMQKALWDSPHSSNTKIIPGKLSLCVGLPVMIRQNAATELCITRGQEGFVHSWQSATGSHGQRILDTLFVRLSKPPKPVDIPGLPRNVVPLTRSSVDTVCSLPDDSSLNVSRSQVEILPNFAMTEYASQGKTRESNVVHVNNSRSHHAIYTALSRGKSAQGTLLVQGFDARKVTGGASGALRQEFRELELLDNITQLRYDGKLPKGMHDADRRNTLIDSFRKCKGLDYMPSTINRAIRWGKSDPFLDWVVKDVEWEILGKTAKKNPDSPKNNFVPARGTEPGTKRKSGNNLSIDMPSRKKAKNMHSSGSDSRIDDNAPIGTPWRDNSCAYDTVIAMVHHIWRVIPQNQAGVLSDLNPEFMGPLIAGFANYTGSAHVRNLEKVRDELRYDLFRAAPAVFPWGQYTSVHSMLDQLLETAEDVMTSVRMCPAQHPVNSAPNSLSNCLITPLPMTADTSLQDYVRNFRVKVSSSCGSCRRELVRAYKFVDAPPVLAFDLTKSDITFTFGLTVPVTLPPQGPHEVSYNLAGVVYHGEHHFTCRVLSPAAIVWSHDGMVAGGAMICEGHIAAVDLRSLGTRNAIIAVYARMT
ncbi:hypothetical protein D9615_010468 [Tricholomella constricta]|uniref:ATP-dependent DNA helicase n=1 Tax=Tricholomella constricta TaxID=117010 RepID=A0A8H5LS08_9AGAR|nr:hypothetical protein D9615_010468 [Tricholomella constricta]